MGSCLRRTGCKCRPFLVLLLLLCLQLALFIITVLISYAVESAVAHLHHTLFDLDPPLPLETSLMLYCVSLVAECITEVQHKNWTILLVKNHYFLLTVVPNIAYFLILSLAFINIFIEFQAFHSIESWHFGVPEQSGQTALYMISISYVVFCLTRVIRKDLFTICKTLPHHQHSHSIVLLTNFICQCISTTVYSIPLVLIATASALWQWHIALEFTLMISAGTLLGIGDSVLESRKPWPKIRKSPPFYWYENAIYSRTVLLEMVLVPSVHYLFFEPGKLNILNTKDRHLVYFIFATSVCLSHTVKIITTALVVHGNTDLIFGWSWGKPDKRSQHHKSQSGLVGEFLREDEEDENLKVRDNEDDGNNGGTDSIDRQNRKVANTDENFESSNPLGDNNAAGGTQGGFSNVNASSANENISSEWGLPSFCLRRELLLGPISALISFGFSLISKVETSYFLNEGSVEKNEVNESNSSNTTQNSSVVLTYLEEVVHKREKSNEMILEKGDSLIMSPLVIPEDISNENEWLVNTSRINRSKAVPIVVDNVNNNFRN